MLLLNMIALLESLITFCGSMPDTAARNQRESQLLKGNEMPKFFAHLVLATAILQAGGGAVHASQNAPVSNGLTGTYYFRLAAAERAVERRSPPVLNPGLGGLCCGTIGSPIIPPDTPMRNPRAPAEPRMPGQQPASGTTSTVPGD